MSEPWIEAPHLWKTKAAFFLYLRGALRRAVWEKWPPKFEFKNALCKPPPPEYTGKARTGSYCALTGKWVGKSAAEIDHIHGHVSLQDWDDVLPFIQHLCASKDNMQYVDKEAHRIKSYADRMGITFKEASAIKQAIAICKAKQDREFLAAQGIVPASNAAGRRKQIEQILKAD